MAEKLVNIKEVIRSLKSKTDRQFISR